MWRTILQRSVFVLFTFASLAFTGAANAQGLRFASEERLRGIPLAAMPFSGAELPTTIDMTKLMPPIGNQGHQNSCVGWTVAYALKSYQERVEAKATQYDFDANGSVSKQEVFSPSYIYNQINEGNDAGCDFTDALNLLSSQGVATWDDMPYNETDYKTPPKPEVKARARIYRIDTWRRVNVADTSEVKAHLAAGFPVMVGAMLDEGFMRADAAFIWHESTGATKGAHAMLVVGYDDHKNAFKLMNSWGTNWGDRGYGWIDYEFFRKAVREAYVAKEARHINRPQPVQPVNPNNPDQPVVNNPQPAPVDPAQLLQMVQFRWGQMVHNIMMPGHPEAGWCMGLMGRVDVPGGLGSNVQVVMFYFYDDGTGRPGHPVRSRSVKFATANGQAADGTGMIPLGLEGIGNMMLTSIVPYSVLDIPIGHTLLMPNGRPFYQPRTTALVAVPVLFIDGFGVMTGPTQHFVVTR